MSGARGAGPCSNSAACADSTTSGSVAVAAYVCSCEAGYEGDQCETDINECASSPCGLGGICSDSSNTSFTVAPNAYACNCSTGWQGVNCAVDVDECGLEPCLHGGTCSESSSNSSILAGSYTCTCAAGWSGAQCGTNVAECATLILLILERAGVLFGRPPRGHAWRPRESPP